jgi:intracellular sulfur oxidation DsrE/DsrF family protein
MNWILTALSVFLVLGLVIPSTASAAEKRHSVLFELTSDDSHDWTAALNNIENLRKAFGPEHTQIELVVHGEGLPMLVAGSNPVQERITGLIGGGVVFAACQNTMKRQNVTAAQLIPGVVTVDSGVAEVVRKQEQGWAYIRSR